jgi:MFS family permease
LRLGASSAALLACCIAFFWAQSSRAVLYSAMPAISAETGLDAARVGLVTGTMYAGYTVAVYVSGLLPFRRRVTIAGGLLATAIANVGFAGVSGLPAMLVLAGIGGAGVGLYLPRGAVVIVESFKPDARGRAMGWHEVSAAAGLMASPLFMGAMLLVVSWRVAVATWSVVGVGAALAVWRWVPEGAPRSAHAGTARLPLDARALTLACVGGSCFVVMSGFATMLPTIVARGWGVSPPEAASFTGWTRTSGLAGSVIGGILGDRISRVEAVRGAHAVVLAATVVLCFQDYGAVFAVLIMVMTAAACAAATSYYALLGDTYRPDERERIFGPIAAAASLIGSVSTPIVLGAVLDRISARATLIAMLGAGMLGLAGATAYQRVMRSARRRGLGAATP